MSTGPEIIDMGNYKVIDPNPPGHTINHEDLYIYASLVAKTKGRSFLTENTDGSFDTEEINISTVDLVVSDSATRNKNKREYLTTNWTEIGGSQTKDTSRAGDLEGFGITNIDVKIESSYIPSVTIDFVDIRGATLFEQGSCSPYSLFFHLPYPVFELTLKGYYGKPVTYFLNLIKFNTKFNSETGNFECRGEFIGWSYAFLADILMGYVRCSAEMDTTWKAQTILRQKYDNSILYYHANGLYDANSYDEISVPIEGNEPKVNAFCRTTDSGAIRCKTITNLIEDIRDIEHFLKLVKGSNSYDELVDLLAVRNRLVSMRGHIVDYGRKLSEGDYVDEIVTSEGLPEKNYKYIFQNDPATNTSLMTLTKAFWKKRRFNTTTDTIEGGIGRIVQPIYFIKKKEVEQSPIRCGGDYVAVGSQIKGNPAKGLTGCVDLDSGDTKEGQMLDALDNKKFQKGLLDNESEGLYYTDVSDGTNNYYIDLGFPIKIVDDDIETITKLIDKKRQRVKDVIDSQLINILGFRPTIRNVFTVFCANVETFIQMLLDCSIMAEKYHRKPDQAQTYIDDNSNSTEILLEAQGATEPSNGIVYPWPTYYKTTWTTLTTTNNKKEETKEEYPGVNPKFQAWWEVKFVEDFIDGCAVVNQIDEGLQEDTTGLPGFDNYIPINPIETKLVSGDNCTIKYWKLRQAEVGESNETISQRALIYIAERMFVTLDYTLFDPVRLNTINAGFGQGPKVWGAATVGGQLSDNWFRKFPQYSNNFEIPKLFAKIDANNLLNTLKDKPEILEEIKLHMNDDIVETVANALSSKVQRAGKEYGLFKTNVPIYHINKTLQRANNQIILYNPFDNNYNEFNAYWGIWQYDGAVNQNLLAKPEAFIEAAANLQMKSKSYWEYVPPLETTTKANWPKFGDTGGIGAIQFLGKAGSGTGTKGGFIYPNKTKMMKRELFKIYTEDEYINARAITLDDSIQKDRIEELFEDFSEALGEKVRPRFHSNEMDNKAIPWEFDKTKSQSLYFNLEDTGAKWFQAMSHKSNELNYNSNNPKHHPIAYPPPASMMGVQTSTNVTNTAYGQNMSLGAKYEWKRKTIVGSQSLVWSTNAIMMCTGSNMVFAGLNRGGTEFFQGSNFGTVDNNIILPIMELPGQGLLTGTIEKPNLTLITSDEGSVTFTQDEEVGAAARDSLSVCGIFETLIQSPIWLDNVNSFRKSTLLSKGEVIGIDIGVTANSGNSMQGPGRTPLIDKGNLQAPQWDEEEEGRWSKGKKYTSDEIQYRNLAYLFLASCKPTPFITDPLTEVVSLLEKGTPPDTANWEPQPIAFNEIQSYEKALYPFSRIGATVKVPKLWVLAMGATLWRYKCFMGLTTDGAGNINWRSPFYNHKPTGYDPLSQPGHPSVGDLTGSLWCNEYGEAGSGENAGITNYVVGIGSNAEVYPTLSRYKDKKCGQRQNRSKTTEETTSYNPATSYMNDCFSQIGNVVAENHIQKSCFWRTTTQIRGACAALFKANKSIYGEAAIGGNENGDNVFNYSQFNTPSQAIDAFGYFFDYWGVYNNDENLSRGKVINECTPYINSPQDAPYRTNVGQGGEGISSFINTVPGQNQSSIPFFTANHLGAWWAWFKAEEFDLDEKPQKAYDEIDFIKSGYQVHELGPDFEATEEYPSSSPADGYGYLSPSLDGHPALDHQVLTANEASKRTYWPNLWISPWQHFYTEPINKRGGQGADHEGGPTFTGWDIPLGEKHPMTPNIEKHLTYIPMDQIFRDYSGTFEPPKIQNDVNDFIEKNLNFIDWDNCNIWSDDEKKEWFEDLEKESPVYDDEAVIFSKKIFWFNTKIDNSGVDLGNEYYTSFGTKDSNSPASVGYYCDDRQGHGRYGDFLALLPNFIKDEFVQKFEAWVEDEFIKPNGDTCNTRPNAGGFLSTIDPVNFGSDQKNKLQDTYRLNSFSQEGSRPFDYLIGGANAWFTEHMFSHGGTASLGAGGFIATVALDENKSNVKDLHNNLYSQYYHIASSTPLIWLADFTYNEYKDPSEFDLGDNDYNTQDKWWGSWAANEVLVKTYLEAFQKEFNDRYNKIEEEGEFNDNGDDDLLDGILDDDDIKLSLYRTFKSINDKWISSSQGEKDGNTHYFFNVTSRSAKRYHGKKEGISFGDTVPLAGHFSYVNRVMGEIGNSAVLDLLPMIKEHGIQNNPKMSFYNLISNILGENRFDFFPLPTFSNFTSDKSDEARLAMFEPFTNNIVKDGGPNFICMYVGGTSRMVDLRPKANCAKDVKDLNYKNDGFGLSNEGSKRPTEITDPFDDDLIARKDKDSPWYSDNRMEGQGFTAFRVAYGLENQNMFKSIELDQSEFSETQESLQIIDKMANSGDPAGRTQKGNNLHNVYLTRSYTCKVESLGNMMIQPLQYFELTNVPMFYGAYIITQVTHNVKPHHLTTSFTGVRQPIATVPVITDVATAMNLSMKDLDPIGGLDLDNIDRHTEATGGSSDDIGPIHIGGGEVRLAGISYWDVGLNSSADYFNHMWKRCDGCEGNGNPGRRGIDYNSDGSVRKIYWVAYDQPTYSLTSSNVDTIVLHWTAGHTFNGMVRALKKRGVHYHFSAHEDGNLYQISDLSKAAYHAGYACPSSDSSRSRGFQGINSKSIGINYIGGVEEDAAGYVRTVDEWNKEDWVTDRLGKTYNAKKQFESLVEACVLAKAKHPTIKRITSHHWITNGKIDVGDGFPYDILLNLLKEYDSEWEDVIIWNDVPDCRGTRGNVRDTSPTTETGDIDIIIGMDAEDQEYADNWVEPVSVNGQEIGTGINVGNTKPNDINNPIVALQYAGYI